MVVVKSDNCRVQYKCADVFGMYQSLAKEYKKTFIVCYGASGHGRGLVDGMSSFGVKNPLRQHIITEDFYWSTASQLVEFFHDKGFASQTRQYSEITVEKIESQQQPTSFPIPGNTKMHMIVFKSDGTVKTKRDICECIDCIEGNIDKCNFSDYGKIGVDEIEDDDNVEFDDNDEDNEEEVDGRALMISEIVREHRIGSVIALRTPPEVKESFYLVFVTGVKKAEKDLFDS